MSNVDDERMSEIKIHLGRVLIEDLAGKYGTVIKALYEAVQNAIDAGATRIAVTANEVKRRIDVQDDGEGRSPDEMNEVFASVRNTLKSADKRKYGRYGIGLFSYLSSSEKVTFTSCSRKGGGYNRWVLNSKEIAEQSDRIRVPYEPCPNLRFSAKKTDAGMHTYVPWRTQLSVTNYTKERGRGLLPPIPEIKAGIILRFRQEMLKRSIRIDIRILRANGIEESELDIVAQPYLGRPLKKVAIENVDAGTVTFDLYLAHIVKGEHHGIVNVGESHNPFRFAFKDLVRSSRHFLDDNVVRALSSGIFEGDIHATKVRLHADRTSFEENDAFLGFCSALEEWYETEGKAFIDTVKEKRRDEDYRDAVNHAFEEVFSVLDKYPAFSDYAKLLKEGVNPLGRKPVADPNGVEYGDVPPASIKKKNTEPRDRKDGKGGGVKRERRTPIRYEKAGIEVCHSAIVGSDNLWEFNRDENLLEVNLHHPDFVKMDSSERNRKQLHVYILMDFLVRQTYFDDDHREVVELFQQPFTKLMTDLFLNSWAFGEKRKK